MRRNIVLEGPDHAGKSTLAEALHVVLGMPLKAKEGKPATFEDTLDKIRMYLDLTPGWIIDRHPIVTQQVYGSTVRRDPPVPHPLRDQFYAQNPLIIYCRCIDKRLLGHLPSPTDTPDHLDQIEEQYEEVLGEYDIWAAKHANIIYTRYDQSEQVIAMARAAVLL